MEISYLQSERDPVAPLCRIVDQRVQDQGAEELPNHPAKIDVCCPIALEVLLLWISVQARSPVRYPLIANGVTSAA